MSHRTRISPNKVLLKIRLNWIRKINIELLEYKKNPETTRFIDKVINSKQQKKYINFFLEYLDKNSTTSRFSIKYSTFDYLDQMIAVDHSRTSMNNP